MLLNLLINQALIHFIENVLAHNPTARSIRDELARTQTQMLRLCICVPHLILLELPEA